MITKAAAEDHLTKLANSITFAIKVWRDRPGIRDGRDFNDLLSGIVSEQLKLEIQSLHAAPDEKDQQPDDGGPAFPVTASTGDPRDGVYCRDGMSLLDWFAGNATSEDIEEHMSIAMQGHPGGESKLFTREQAKYRYAAAMIAAKKEMASK